MTEGLEQKAVEIISQLQALSPDVAGAALGAAQATAINHILAGVVLLVGSAALAWWTRRVWGWRNGEPDDFTDEDVRIIGGTLLSCITGGASIVLAIVGAGALTYVPAWVGIWHPEIYLAAKVLG